MPLLRATWKVTFGGTTLLDFSDCMLSEPRLPREEQGETVLKVRAPFAAQFARGNVQHTLTFSRLKIFATAVAAREFLLAHVSALPTGIHDARIQTQGGAGYSLASARLLPLDAGVADGCRYEAVYTLVGGALTPVGDAISEGGDTLVDDDGTLITDDPPA